MTRYLFLFIFASMSIIMDGFLVTLAGKPQFEDSNGDAESILVQGAMVALGEAPDGPTEINPHLCFFLFKMLLLIHALGTLFVTFVIWRKLIRCEDEVRMAKAESEIARATLIRKTAEQLNGLRVIAELVKKLEKALKERQTNTNSVSRDSLRLN